MRNKALTCLTLVLLALATWQVGNAAWIHAKARLAQHLISQAWRQTLQQQAPVKPWSWADTWPVARLRWQDVDLYVLAGVNGAALPFGPGMDMQVNDNTRLIAGHRDTHFAFLADIQVEDRLTLTDMQGRETHYRIQSRQVMDSRITSLPTGGNSPTLLLVTCYPFDALRARGPLRLVIRAVPERQVSIPSNAAGEVSVPR